MKKYIVDKLLMSLFGVGIIVGASVPGVFGPISALVIKAIAVLVFGSLSWQALVLPLDIIIGEEKKSVCFSTVNLVEQYEFFRRLYCCTWRFYEANNVIDLIVPASLPKAGVMSMECPPKDEKIEIRYYHFSKILIGWDKVKEK